MKTKISGVVFLAAWGYLVYCAMDRLCIKSYQRGIDRGFEIGNAAGKLNGYLGAIGDMASNDEEESQEEEESE